MDTWPQFRQLCELASATNEGRGGIAALEGFSFQFLVSLEAMVRASGGGGSGSVFLETLSDITERQGPHVVIAQVKRTLSSSTVGKGLEDLWKIDSLARSHTPQLQETLRYKLLGSRRDLAEVDRRISGWKPDRPFDEDRLAAFRARLSWDCIPDPLTSLAASLVNLFAVADPFGLIEQWLGTLLGQPTRDGLAVAANRISIDVQGLESRRRELQGRFRLWSTEDRPPREIVQEEDRTKAVLTGQTPHRTDLAAGRFAKRSIYADIAREAERWLVENNSSDRELLGAFWISGRSGTGKSVALLHLLSSLHSEDTRRVIIWLENDSRRIGEAIRWSRPYVARGYQVIVAADDPFTAARQADLDAALIETRAEIEAMIELYPEALRPVLFFCGPTEQAEAFTYEFGDQVRTRLYPLPLETKADLDELRDWYRQRTGQGAPLRETKGILIVQLFFEWSTGEKMVDFARRFRRRLEDLMPGAERGAFHLVAEILALNRLYSLFPGAALERELEARPDLGAAFDRLEEVDSHFSFVPHLGGYRLTHPHLADAIYRTWFEGPANRRHRKAHLMRGIRAALEHGEGVSQRLAPLWALSRLIMVSRDPHPDDAGRIDLVRDEVREVLADIYRQDFASTSAPVAELPVWANLDHALSLQLTPSPLVTIVAAVKAASIDTPGLRLACHILMLHHDKADEALAVVRHLLEHHPAWKEWPKVALSYMRQVGLLDLAPALTRYVSERPVESRELANMILHRDLQDFRANGAPIVAAWFQRHGPYLQFQAGFLTDFIDRWGMDAEIAKTGYDLLSRFPTHPSWSYVWGRLSANDGAITLGLAELGLSWMADFNPEQRGWGWVWTSFWSSHPELKEELTALALSWLRWVNQNDGSWSRVWEVLWDAAPGDAEVRAVGVSWLSGVERSDRSWTYVWGKLWLHEVGAGDLRKVGLEWLRQTSHDHASWTFVWKPLWDFQPGAPDLIDAALDWLREAPVDHASWALPWRLLWEHEPGSGKLVQTALDWLSDTQPDHQAWSLTWKQLWEHDPETVGLRRLGLDWLECAPDHPFWTSVWIPLWNDSGRAPALRQVALDWLAKTSPDHPSWRFGWEPLWREDPGASDLRQAALGWLSDSSPDGAQWQSVWHLLWAREPGADDLSQLALKWLRTAPDHPSWKFVWEPLWRQDSDSGEPERIALEWLKRAPNHLSWYGVWASLWANAPGSADLRQCALDWLASTAPDHPSWRFTWQLLWREDVGAEDLRQIALRWLGETSPGNVQWNFVWKSLWSRERDSGDLRQVATEWLGAMRDHPSWNYVWEPLWLHDPGAADLRRLAVDWLREVSCDHRAWKFVWEPLWRHDPGADDLQDIAQAWLLEAFRHSSWSFVWETLWTHSAFASAELAALAGRWLEEVDPRHGSWGFVWAALWRSPDLVKSSSGALVSRALDWLQTGDVSGSCWPIVWNFLWRGGHGSTDTLRDLASTLLAEHPPNHDGRIRAALESPRVVGNILDWRWADGWKKAWVAADGKSAVRQRLFHQGLNTVSEVNLDLGGWSSVWRLLWKNRELAEGAPEALKACCLEWLEKVDPVHPRWAAHWHLLWEPSAGESGRELAEIAMRWLATNGQRLGWAGIWVILWQDEAYRPALRTLVESGSRQADMLSNPSPEVQSRLLDG